MAMTITVDDLSALLTAAIDARSGYVEALKDVKGDDITTLFQQMIATHTENAEELRAEIVKQGTAVDYEGSFMGTVHRSIMNIRSLFGGLDASILPGLIDGEERNANAYSNLLKTVDPVDPFRDVLLKQHDRIVEQITLMKAKVQP